MVIHPLIPVLYESPLEFVAGRSGKTTPTTVIVLLLPWKHIDPKEREPLEETHKGKAIPPTHMHAHNTK